MPQAGVPLIYVTTPTFLSVFGLATLRDLPEIEAMLDVTLSDGDVVLPGPRGDGAFDELGDLYPFDGATDVSEGDV